MRNISELNVNDGGRAVLREGPSLKLVGEFERHFGVSLPPDFLAFLHQVNGGHPEIDSFVPMGSSSANRFNVDRFYHLSEISENDTLNIWRATQDWRKVLGSSCVPVGRDGGGNQIYLDLARDGEVVLCIHDDSFKRVHIAESFSVFLDLLEIDEGMI